MMRLRAAAQYARDLEAKNVKHAMRIVLEIQPLGIMVRVYCDMNANRTAENRRLIVWEDIHGSHPDILLMQIDMAAHPDHSGVKP